jgi:hypothetical protein
MNRNPNITIDDIRTVFRPIIGTTVTFYENNEWLEKNVEVEAEPCKPDYFTFSDDDDKYN